MNGLGKHFETASCCGEFDLLHWNSDSVYAREDAQLIPAPPEMKNVLAMPRGVELDGVSIDLSRECNCHPISSPRWRSHRVWKTTT